MGLNDNSWYQEDIDFEGYVGKYVTHDSVNKDSIEKQLDHPDRDWEFGEHILDYKGKKMNVKLTANRKWAQILYDETFEEEFGDEDPEMVINYFLTPDQFKSHSPIHPD